MRMALGTLVATTACLGADTLASDAGRIPQLQLYSNTFVVNAVPNAVRHMSIEVTRRSYSGRVTMRVDSLPDGVTATFDPAELGDRERSAVLTIRVADDAAPGNHHIFVRATAPFVRSGRASIGLALKPE